jgi:hypothetical protein
MSEKGIVAIIFMVPPVWGATVEAVGAEDVMVVVVVAGVTAALVCLGAVVEVEQLVKIKPPIKMTAKIITKYFFISNSLLLHEFNINCSFIHAFLFYLSFLKNLRICPETNNYKA